MFCIDRAAFLYAIASNVLVSLLVVGVPAFVLLFLHRRKSRRSATPER